MLPAGLAVFVKTPGISPLKTRLAATIGQSKAEEFYQLSCHCLEQTLVTIPQLQSYWALADAGSLHPLWQSLPQLQQGPGALGEKLDRIYQQLLDLHGKALLIGADAPQLSETHLRQALAALEHYDFVFGPAYDGGFYLMGGRLPIPRDIWLATPYSDQETLAILRGQLANLGSSACLEELRDVDVEDDLTALRLIDMAIDHPAKASLQHWLNLHP